MKKKNQKNEQNTIVMTIRTRTQTHVTSHKRLEDVRCCEFFCRQQRTSFLMSGARKQKRKKERKKEEGKKLGNIYQAIVDIERFFSLLSFVFLNIIRACADKHASHGKCER